MTVWVFNGECSPLPAGIFSHRSLAESWIGKNRLSGTLSEFPLDTGAYDHAVANSLFVPKREHEASASFIADFSRRLKHIHFVDGQSLG